MEENKIREPVQKRSIEKKEKIIKAGFDLICDKGYHNTNTVEIAKAAGVSTGIVYQYFKDKRDIFIAGIKEYSNHIMYPMIDILSGNKIDKDNLESLLKSMIDSFIKSHYISKSAHEEMLANSHLDPEIADIFNNSEIEMTNKIVTLLRENGFNTKNLPEKVHMIIGIVENLCHEIVYHKHPSINYDIMTDEVIHLIVNLIKE